MKDKITVNNTCNAGVKFCSNSFAVNYADETAKEVVFAIKEKIDQGFEIDSIEMLGIESDGVDKVKVTLKKQYGDALEEHFIPSESVFFISKPVFDNYQKEKVDCVKKMEAFKIVKKIIKW